MRQALDVNLLLSVSTLSPVLGVATSAALLKVSIVLGYRSVPLMNVHGLQGYFTFMISELEYFTGLTKVSTVHELNVLMESLEGTVWTGRTVKDAIENGSSGLSIVIVFSLPSNSGVQPPDDVDIGIIVDIEVIELEYMLFRTWLVEYQDSVDHGVLTMLRVLSVKVVIGRTVD